MRRFVLAVFACVSMFLVFASCSDGQPDKKDETGDVNTVGDYVPGQVIVKFKNEINPEERDGIIENCGGKEIIDPIGPPEIMTFLISLKPDVAVEEAVKLFEAREEVEYAEPNYIQSIH